MSLKHTFIAPDTTLVDSGIYYSDVVDLSDYRTMAYDIEVHERTSGSVNVSFQRQVKEGGDWIEIEGASSLAAVGHNHGALNSFVNETDVLGRIRVKVDGTSGSGVGFKVDVSVVAL